MGRAGRGDGIVWYYLLSAGTNLAAHIHGGGCENQANCTLNHIVNQGNVQCRFEKCFHDGGAWFRIIFRHSGCCIQCDGACDGDDTNVSQNECGDYEHGFWGFWEAPDCCCECCCSSSSCSSSDDW